jgi:hypothetical protein
VSIYVRKPDIKKHDIRGKTRALPQSGDSGLSDHNVMPSHLKKHRHRLRRGGVVVNDQYLLLLISLT